MKRIVLILLSICFAASLLAGCEENYQEKVDEKFYPITSCVDDTQLFIQEITNFALTYDEELTLGQIELFYDKNLNLEITFEFSKPVSERFAKNLTVLYDAQKKGVFYSSYVVGSPKIAQPFEDTLDVSNWKISFSQGLSELQKDLNAREIKNFNRIGCTCYENEWRYWVFMTAYGFHSYEYSICPDLEPPAPSVDI